MNRLENPLTFVRSMKGAAASVLLALLFIGRAMTNQELQRWTGYGNHAISDATSLLVDLGWLIARSKRGPWSLAAGRQLPLMPGAEELPAGSLKIMDASPSILQVGDRDGLAQAGRAEADFVKALHALYKAGIHEPTAGRLAALPHVTPEYVIAHVAKALSQGRTLGAAIYRMQRGWPAPHYRACLSVEDNISRFLGEGKE